MMHGLSRGLLIAALLVVPLAVRAQISPNADIVYLRTNCTGASDCVTQMSQLTSFLWARTPKDRPVLVDIGPGSFPSFNCPLSTPHNGFVTLRGSGRDRTRLAGFSAWTCDKLAIQDLMIDALGFAIVWSGGGSSQWSNVNVAVNASGGAAIGWLDLDAIPATPKAVHYWFGSKITARASGFNYGFYVQSSEHWFYGGEVESDLSGSTGSSITANVGVNAIAAADFRAFGSALRSHAGSFCGPGTLQGVRVAGSATFRMHGGIIDVDARSSAAGGCGTAINTIALDASGSGRAYTPGTSFQVAANGAGTQTRLRRQGTAVIESPFLWPPGTTPPVVASTTGSDLFVETDCETNGACNGGSETHLMVYSDVCTSGWFDATRGACRP